MSEKTGSIAPAADQAALMPPATPKLLVVSASPHIHSGESVPRIMLFVVVALLPAAGIAVMLSGLHALYSIGLSIVTAGAAEWLILFFVHKTKSIPDGSAIVTGFLVALSLPPSMPLWAAPLGSLFAIALVKMAFGGLGGNFLNPALAGRAFLVTAFPVLFGTAAAQAGGNMSLPAGGSEINSALLNFLTGYECGWMGGASAGALLIGAILLWSLKIIDFTLPISFIGSFFLVFWCTGRSAPLLSSAALLAPLFQVLSGGILFGAFFLATDPVTSPLNKRARFLFGTGCGILTFIFQKFGSFSDGMMQAVLIMNFTVPYMDRYLAHRIRKLSPEKKRAALKIVEEPLKPDRGSDTAVVNEDPREPDTGV
jgi:Na+-translocating ferredoxin:NAD+ oxidoreductase subunit D